jgi:glutathione peroxidase
MLSLNRSLSAVLLTVLLSVVAAFGANKDVKIKAKNHPLQFKMADIDGDEMYLPIYVGQVVLIVNVASNCRFTPQYAALQELYVKYEDQGFVILGFPANNFRNQEPGTNGEIKDFCTKKYGVTFPLFAKVSVKGNNISPLYSYLTSRKTNPGFEGEIPWNFTKFLVNRQGKVVARFQPEQKPDDPEVVQAIEKAIAEK